MAGYLGTLEWRFELASHFKLQYLFGSLAFGLLFAVLKQWRWVVAAALCALISGFSVVPWYFPNSQPGSGQRVRLLLSNVYVGNSRYDALTDLIRAENPDLLFIQEVTPPWAKQLERIRNQYPHGVIRGAEDEGGIASLSRLPLVQAGDAGIGDYNGPSLELRLNIGARLVHIINTHTPPPMGKRNAQRRNEHFEVIADRLRDLPAPKILIGDLNATMWSPYFKRLVERTELVNVREGFGVLPTWPTFLPLMKIPIDHCLVSRDIRVVGVRTGAHIGSDHLPLIVDLELERISGH
jgi:endonuclease/exonuclease/phosphatase (EEP) superfamily protein YafD